MKHLLLLVLTLILWSMGTACNSGEPAPDATDPAATTTTSPDATDPAGEESNASPTASEPAQVSDNFITDAVVQQVCDCQNNAKQDDGSIDFAQMGECMGGKNKIEFVKDLLGPDASDKARSDAEKLLTERMEAQCPR